MKEQLHLFERTKNDDDFKQLEQELNNELLSRYGTVQEQYMKHDCLHSSAHVIVVYFHGQAIGCGCLQLKDSLRGEIKRMFVLQQHRNKQVGGMLLAALETKAQTLGVRHLLLETGIRQPESIALYDKHGFVHIDPFRHGEDVQESIFFGKQLMPNETIKSQFVKNCTV